MKEIIINKKSDESLVIAMLENGKLVEEYEQTREQKLLEGNVYCGKVRDILPGMQSAFIDIGEHKNAFIHIKDIIPKMSNQTGNKEEELYKYKIKNYIKQNDSILVQVKKDEADQKGARVSKHISLTGRMAVLMVNTNFITVSQKIEDEIERKRLVNLVNQIMSEIKEELNTEENYGIILRTAAYKKSKEEIKKDIKELIENWIKIQQNYNKASKLERPTVLYKNNDMLLKFLMGVLESGIQRIIVNEEKTYEMIKLYLEETGMSKNLILEMEKDADVMKIYDLQEQIEKMLERKIWLKCGGFITIDKTEALTAIDVNSGKFIGKKTSTKNDTILKVNKEATVEIARQLRLRNINGIIVIDYIDMETNEQRKQIEKILNDELKKDRSKTQVIGFTRLDLLEMTRKKM